MRYLLAFFGALLIMICGSMAGAQETYFGKNKVQYRDFSWDYIQTDHFDVYFYDDDYELAKFAGEELEKAYTIVTDQLQYFVARRVPVFVYSSHNDFQQTNIIDQEPTEGTLGFTEVFKNRMVVHFMGSYAEFRHLLHHELTHAVVYDMVYGQFFKSLISSARLFEVPLWLAEGYAEYSSNGGWAAEADMVVRDATIHGYLQPPEYMDLLSYTEGFALVKYIVDNYGVEKTGEIFKRGKAQISIDRALKSAIGLDLKELYEKFSKEMKQRYWPDIALRQEAKDFATQLTHHGEDGSHYNEKPVFSPDGKSLAMISDRNGYSEIFLISPVDGRKIARLVKGERNAQLESLHWYTSGMSFSPDGQYLVFVSKSKGEDALNILRIKGNDIIRQIKLGLKSIISPAWSPDSNQIAFTALDAGARDLYLYNLKTDLLTQLTKDLYDDADVAWYPDGRRLVFSSDRPHPDNPVTPGNGQRIYGDYNLHEINVATQTIYPLLVGPGQNHAPTVSPAGDRIAFVSGRNGIDNIYIYYADSSRVAAVTDIITGAASPTWDAQGEKIAFSTFYHGGFDIYIMKTTETKGDHGLLPMTDFALGKYDSPGDWARSYQQSDRGEDSEAASGEKPMASIKDPDLPGGTIKRPSEFTAVAETEADTGYSAAAGPARPEETAGEVLDRSPADTLLAADSASAVDTSVAETTAAGPEDEDEVYTYNAPPEEGVFAPSGNIETEDGRPLFTAQPVDSLITAELDNKSPDGEYKVRPYKTKFTPDIIAGGLQYDTFFGFRGQTVFLFSDYLGDHQIIIATDLVNTIDQSNLQVFYGYNRHRVNFGLGLFHTKNYYLNSWNELFSDRIYGLYGNISRPQSKFTRLDLDLATVFIDRRNYEPDSTRNVRLTTAALSWTNDTVLWGITGPVKGRRAKLVLETGMPFFGTQTIRYYSVELDYRQYIKLGQPFTFAFRYAGGFAGKFKASDTTKNYYLGGNVNKIGSISVDNDIYRVENLYFANIVTPLRGYDYYDLAGTRFSVINTELRFPFVDYFIMRYPLRLGLSQITGALFLDVGAAWNGGDSTFKGASGSRLVGVKSGFGFGARANLGFLVLRYDLAWRTNFNTVEPHTKHYFSLGADF